MRKVLLRQPLACICCVAAFTGEALIAPAFAQDAAPETPEEVSQRMAADFKRWKEILDSIGYTPPK